MEKLKQGDEVIIIAGKSKGHRGAFLRRLENDRVVVEGGNMIRKHIKPNPNKGVEGGIVDREAGIHVSNVAIYNPTSKKADRIGIKVLEDGRKVRVFKSNQEQIDS